MALELLGKTLLTTDGPKPTADVLEGKQAVGVYFSAHWCPPCRGFTPKLAEWYTGALKAKGLEVVFVSSDRDQKAFDEYYAEMPWAAVPFEDRAAKEALSKKFGVEGIPTLVILDAKTGEVLQQDGRAAVCSDPLGADFPWKPKSLAGLLQGKLLKKGGETAWEALEGKVVGLYFSAHWCPPCRGFTPQLAKRYQELQQQGHPVEIVFYSSDQDQASFGSYFGEMPWLAAPFEDRAAKDALSSHFGVAGIPTLVLLDADRNVITTEGRARIFGDFPFSGVKSSSKFVCPAAAKKKKKGCVIQ